MDFSKSFARGVQEWWNLFFTTQN